MKVKKIGKARIDLKTEQWFVEGSKAQYRMNPRLVDTRKDVKEFRAQYVKLIQRDTPSRRKPMRREQHFQEMDAYRQEAKTFFTGVFQEILKDSFEHPILLQKDKDHIHARQWIFCLYQGAIYEFEKSGLDTDQMMDMIRAKETPSESEVLPPLARD